MGLQIRLRHALGERVVEVRPRTIDLPLVVGRSKESDLQIPSVTVAAHHCVLFVHDGQWVVQDLAGATSLNDEPLSGPAALHVGDVLTIGAGAGPATIEIDPAGVEAGRTGAAATEMIATPVPVAAPVYAPQPSRMPQAAGISAFGQSRPIGRMMPAAPPPPPRTAVAAADEDSVDWGLPAEPGPQRFYVPRRKQNAGPMIAVAVIAAVVIIGGMVAIISYLRPPPPAPPPAAKVVEEPTKHLKSMFDVPGGESPPAKSPSAPRPQRTTPPADSSDDNSGSSSSAQPSPDSPAVANAARGAPSSASDSDADSHAGDADWDDVEGAAIAGEPTTAILKIDDYSQKHPGKSTAELKKFENDCLDRLWWQRVTQLCNKRAHLHKQIAKDAQDLRESRDAAFKAETTKEQQGFEVELQCADNVLRNEMGYSDDAAPDISDKTQMAKLHAARNPYFLALGEKDRKIYSSDSRADAVGRG